ncbi:hypothetical protein CEXT_733201 [Caerostris extrusa]|uniref:Uncharacterized protein n=1 Tax=Caerostris extrusa TaxID=172846 RepID=A0AAV4QY93_CAEEX|nr:hypothetical protein CEXT_733201 [Caerostris extrusa]
MDNHLNWSSHFSYTKQKIEKHLQKTFPFLGRKSVMTKIKEATHLQHFAKTHPYLHQPSYASQLDAIKVLLHEGRAIMGDSNNEPEVKCDSASKSEDENFQG